MKIDVFPSNENGSKMVLKSFETDCPELLTLDPTGQFHICVNRWKCEK